MIPTDPCHQCFNDSDDCTCRPRFCYHCDRDVLAVETNTNPQEYACPICSYPIESFEHRDSTIEAESHAIDQQNIRAINAQR
jgi:hypothetical protein